MKISNHHENHIIRIQSHTVIPEMKLILSPPVPLAVARPKESVHCLFAFAFGQKNAAIVPQDARPSLFGLDLPCSSLDNIHQDFE